MFLLIKQHCQNCGSSFEVVELINLTLRDTSIKNQMGSSFDDIMNKGMQTVSNIDSSFKMTDEEFKQKKSNLDALRKLVEGMEKIECLDNDLLLNIFKEVQNNIIPDAVYSATPADLNLIKAKEYYREIKVELVKQSADSPFKIDKVIKSEAVAILVVQMLRNDKFETSISRQDEKVTFILEW